MSGALFALQRNCDATVIPAPPLHQQSVNGISTVSTTLHPARNVALGRTARQLIEISRDNGGRAGTRTPDLLRVKQAL